VSGTTRRWLGRAGLVVLLVAVGLALAQQWDAVRSSASQLTVGAVLGALALAVLATLATALAWRTVLADLGSPVPVGSALRVFLVGQLGKYVPGSVWPVVLQMQLGRSYALPRARVAAASLATIGVGLLSGVLLAAVCLPLAGGDRARSYAFLLALVPVLLVGLHPRVLVPSLDRVLRRVGRAGLDGRLSWPGTLTAVAWTVVSWVCSGAGTWLLLRDLGGTGGLLLATGAFAAAWTAGFVVVVAPAGAGVREAGLVVLLSGALDVGPATLLAICSRAVLTVADVAAAGAAALLGGRPSADAVVENRAASADGQPT